MENPSVNQPSTRNSQIPILRVARPTHSLDQMMHFYQDALGLSVVASFDNHNGFDGRILAPESGAPWHLEFTYMHNPIGTESVRSPNPDNVLVLYLPDPTEYESRKSRMEAHGYTAVESVNPYWTEWGVTFEDPEGWRVVLCRREWKA